MKRALFSIFSLMALLSGSCSKGNTEGQLPPYSGEKIRMVAGANTFSVSLFDNATARAFIDMLPMTITMGDVNDNEKFYRLSQNLPGTAVNPGTIRSGDLMVYGGNGLVLFYKTFPTSYSYARIGTIDNPSGLQSALGSGTATITFSNVAQAESYTLTYNTNGATGGSTPAPIAGKNGSSITLDDGTGFNRSGYTFTGWNTQANGNGADYPAGGSYTIMENVILYAKWNTVSQGNNIRIKAGASTFTATLADNETARAFGNMLPITVNMSELNGNEKYYYLPVNLPTAYYRPGAIQNGDIMLYGTNCIVIFYLTFQSSYSYTRIGSVDNPPGLQSALGSGSVMVTFEFDQ